MDKAGYVVILMNSRNELKIVATRIKPVMKAQAISEEAGEQFRVGSWCYVTEAEHVVGMLHEELFEGQISGKRGTYKADFGLTKKMMQQLAKPYLTTVDGKPGRSRWLNGCLIVASLVVLCFFALAGGGDRENEREVAGDDRAVAVVAKTRTPGATRAAGATNTSLVRSQAEREATVGITRTPRATVTRAPTRTPKATRTSVVRSLAEREEDKYRAFMKDRMDELGVWLVDFGELNQTVANDPLLMFDDGWIAQVVIYSELIKLETQEIIDYQAPVRYREFDSELKEIGRLLQEAMEAYIGGLDGYDEAKIVRASNLMGEASRRINKLDVASIATDEGSSQNRNLVGVVTANSLNVRSGPGADNGIVGSLVQGAEVGILGYSDDETWVNIELADGTEGWVSAGYLEVK